MDGKVKYFLKSEPIVDNEGKGDCLFATIRDSYSGIGKQISVAQLRNIASDAATPKVFADFKEQYDMYSQMVQQLGARLTELQGENRILKQQYRGNSSLAHSPSPSPQPAHSPHPTAQHSTAQSTAHSAAQHSARQHMRVENNRTL